MFTRLARLERRPEPEIKETGPSEPSRPIASRCRCINDKNDATGARSNARYARESTSNLRIREENNVDVAI